jgi:hypothetical protein
VLCNPSELLGLLGCLLLLRHLGGSLCGCDLRHSAMSCRRVLSVNLSLTMPIDETTPGFSAFFGFKFHEYRETRKHKHIVKHTYEASYLGFETFVGLSGHIFVLVPRFPSKSGLMNKHIVKHIVLGTWEFLNSMSGRAKKTVVQI